MSKISSLLKKMIELKNRLKFVKFKKFLVSTFIEKKPYISAILLAKSIRRPTIAMFLITDLLVVKMPLNIITTPSKAENIIAFIKP